MHWHDAVLDQALARLASGAADDAVAGVTGAAGKPRPGGSADQRAIVAARLQAQLPVIPVVWYRQTVAVSTRLGGLSIDPFERSYRISTLTWLP